VQRAFCPILSRPQAGEKSPLHSSSGNERTHSRGTQVRSYNLSHASSHGHHVREVPETTLHPHLTGNQIDVHGGNVSPELPILHGKTRIQKRNDASLSGAGSGFQDRLRRGRRVRLHSDTQEALAQCGSAPGKGKPGAGY
jgi:hypothetical protein